MDTPLVTCIKKISQDVTDCTLMKSECAGLRIEFTCEPRFGFVSDRYPDTPFNSLASLLMLERVQKWFQVDYEEATMLLQLVLSTPFDRIEVVKRHDEFARLMASALLKIGVRNPKQTTDSDDEATIWIV